MHSYYMHINLILHTPPGHARAKNLPSLMHLHWRRFSLYKLHSSCIVHVMMKTNDLRVCSCFILMLLFCSNKIVAGECRAWQCCNRPAAHDNDIIIILYSTGSPADGTTRRYCCVSSQHCAVHLC